MQSVTSRDQLSRLLNTKTPLILKLGNSATCPPCRANAPVFKHMGDQYGKKCIFADVDMGKSGDLGFGVKSMPTFIYFVNGVEVKRVSGANSFEQEASDFINQHGKNVFDSSKGKTLGTSSISSHANPWAKKDFNPAKAMEQNKPAENKGDDTDPDLPPGMRMVCDGTTCHLVPIEKEAPKGNKGPCDGCNLM